MSADQPATDDSQLGQGKTCFVIGPIGSKFSPLGTDPRTIYENSAVMWESVYEAACKHFSLTPYRSDMLAQPGEITEQIFTLLHNSEVVIADVTNGNPNVMYELGIRHTQNKVTIQVGEYSRLPFDINTIRTIQFRRTEAGLIEARNNLIEALRDGLNGSFLPVTATRVWSTLSSSPAGSAPIDPSSVATVEEEEPDPPGFIDVLAEGEERMVDVGERLNAVAELIGEIGNLFSAATEEMSQPANQAKGFAFRLQLTRRLKDDLEQPVSALETETEQVSTGINSIDAATKYILSKLAEEPDELAESQEYLDAIVGLADAAEEAGPSIAEMMQQSRDLQKVTKELRSIGNRIASALSQYLQDIATIVTWRAMIRDLPGQS